MNMNHEGEAEMAEAHYILLDEPNFIWCGTCGEYLPATRKHWIPSILKGTTKGRCRACTKAYRDANRIRINAKKSEWERHWRRLNIFQLREVIDECTKREEPVPAMVWERMAIEVNKMKDPEYASKVLAKHQGALQ